MNHLKPHVRTTGEGPTVVLLHSSGSSARQWDTLVGSLQSRFFLQTVDFHGHGATPAWNGERALTLDDDAALAAPLLAAAPGGAHLVGHSYGGAVALKLARLYPQFVASVAVYEPVSFRLLFDQDRRAPAAREVIGVAARIHTSMLAGRVDRSAAHFIDYWSGEGAWEAMPMSRRQAAMSRMPSIVPHFHALFSDSLGRSELGRLGMPALCLTGAQTKASTRRIGELLRVGMPGATHETLTGMGHMGPLTHAGAVAARLAGWLDTQAMLQDALLRLSQAA